VDRIRKEASHFLYWNSDKKMGGWLLVTVWEEMTRGES
jgi:hypothetical protein